jgi:hypothetical protein
MYKTRINWNELCFYLWKTKFVYVSFDHSLLYTNFTMFLNQTIERIFTKDTKYDEIHASNLISF